MYRQAKEEQGKGVPWYRQSQGRCVGEGQGWKEEISASLVRGGGVVFCCCLLGRTISVMAISRRIEVHEAEVAPVAEA